MGGCAAPLHRGFAGDRSRPYHFRLVARTAERKSTSSKLNRSIEMATNPIRFGFQSGQQNVTWERMRDFWRNLDAWGYDSIWVFDHFYPIFTPDPAGPCMENWTLLSALSQHTKRARLGAMVN